MVSYVRWKCFLRQVLLLSIIHDITEHRMAEEALQASEANLRAFLNALPEPAFLLDREGELLIVNAKPAVMEAMRRIRLDTIIPVKGKKK